MTKRTIPILFFAITVFCLCFIQAVLVEKNRMMSEYYELTAQSSDTLKNSTIQAVGLIDGVAESSTYMSASLTLLVNGYSVNVTVHAVSTDYLLNDRYTLGSGLIFNQAAIDAIVNKFKSNRKNFTDYYAPKYSLGADDLLFDLDMVIENKSDNEEAIVYINISQMSLLMKKLGKNSDISALRIKLNNYSYLNHVKDELKSMDISITSNTDAITKEADAYNIHILYLSIIMAVSLLALLSSLKEIDGGILLIGYFIGTVAAVCLPYLFSPFKRGETVFGLSASGWFYLVLFAITAMVITLKEIYNRYSLI